MPVDLLAKKQPVDLLVDKPPEVKPESNPAQQFNEQYGLHPLVGVPEDYGFIAHGVDQGVGVGIGDEVIAAGAATAAKLRNTFNDKNVDWSDAYDQALAARRGEMHDYKRENPKSALAAEIAGGLLTGGGLASSGLTFMKGAKTLPQLAKSGAKEGAAYGAFIGGAASEGDAPDRIWDGLVSGGAGALIGAPLAPAMPWAGSKISKMMGSSVPERKVLNAAKKAEVRPQDAVSKIEKIGPDAMLVDAMGEQGRSLARAAANISPEAEQILGNASYNRMGGKVDRISDALLKSANLDDAKTVDELIDIVDQAKRPAISAAYDQAESLGHKIDLNKFNDLQDSKYFSNAYKKAPIRARERKIADQAENIEPNEFDILDATKKILDGKAGSALKNNKDPDLGGIYSGLSSQVRNRVDESIPEYAGARQMAQDLFGTQDAIKLGDKFAGGNLPADAVRKINAVPEKYRPELLKAYVSGKVNNLQNRRGTPGVLDGQFGSPRQIQVVQEMLGDQSPLLRMMLDAEKRYGQTHTALTGNSTTAKQLSGLSGIGAGVAAGGDLASGGAGYIASRIARKGADKVSRSKKEADALRIAEMLIKRDLPKYQVNLESPLQRLLVQQAAQSEAR